MRNFFLVKLCTACSSLKQHKGLCRIFQSSSSVDSNRKKACLIFFAALNAFKSTFSYLGLFPNSTHSLQAFLFSFLLSFLLSFLFDSFLSSSFFLFLTFLPLWFSFADHLNFSRILFLRLSLIFMDQLNSIKRARNSWCCIFAITDSGFRSHESLYLHMFCGCVNHPKTLA